MKKVGGFTAYGVLFFVFVVLYLNYDSKGHLYGLGCCFCDKNLPYGLSPKQHSDYRQSFVLLDEDGFELVGSGFRHMQGSFRIKNLLDYAYNDTSVLLKCTDSLNNIKYLVSYETGYKSNKGNPAVSFKDIDNGEFGKIKESYQWVGIDEEKANTIRFMKHIAIVGASLSLLAIVKILLSVRRSRVTS